MNHPKFFALICCTLFLFSSIYTYAQDTSSLELPVKLCKIPVPQIKLPQNDSLIYDQFVGETIAGYPLASGWRYDTINGGYNKTVYNHPYLEVIGYDRFEKKGRQGNFTYYHYEKGKRFTGWINDTLVSHLTSEKRLFHAYCINGLVQGKATISVIKTGEVIAEAQFLNGELAGECIYRNRSKKTDVRVRYVVGSGNPF